MTLPALESVKFLSFEGGGAAGLTVHPGAVKALAEFGILDYGSDRRQIGTEGFSGSSSGSVVSTLASCGYTYQEIGTLISQEAFDMVFRFERLEPGLFSKLNDDCPTGVSLPNSASLSLDALTTNPRGALLRYIDPVGLMLDGGLNSSIYVQKYIEDKLNDSTSLSRIYEAELAARAARVEDSKNKKGILRTVADSTVRVLVDVAVEELKDQISKAVLGWGKKEVLKFLQQNYPYVVFRIVEHIFEYSGDRQKNLFNIFKSDYGLFSGCAWKDYIDHLVAFALFRVDSYNSMPDLEIPTVGDMKTTGTLQDLFAGKIAEAYERNRTAFEAASVSLDELMDHYKQECRGCTFERHAARLYGHLGAGAAPPLNISGANISTQESHIFSSATTPWFRIADAVRIATCIPPAFKPVFLEASDIPNNFGYVPDRTGQKHFLEGFWIDGGLFYNSPFEVFQPYETSSKVTLGLGIGLPEAAQVDIQTVTEFFLALVNVVYERNVSATRLDPDRFIDYNNFGIGLFSPRMTPAEISLYRTDAYSRTYEHFSLPILSERAPDLGLQPLP